MITIRRISVGAVLILGVLCCDIPVEAGRFGGGGGGGGNRGGGGGSFTASQSSSFSASGGGRANNVPMQRPSGGNFERPNPGSVNRPSMGGGQGPYGGGSGFTASGSKSSGIAKGPNGGFAAGGQKDRSFETQNGGSFDRSRSGGVVMGPAGNVHAGGSSSSSFTGANGRTIETGQSGRINAGPYGVSASGSRGAVATGPNGTVAGGSRGAVAAGPNGVVAGGSRGAVATGPGGTVAAGSRSGVAVGPYGAIAGGSRGAISTNNVTGRTTYNGTRWVGYDTMRTQGVAVRSNFGGYNSFNSTWYKRNPTAFYATGWTARSVWTYPSWGVCRDYVGININTTPIIYDYGANLIYQDNNVVYNDTIISTQADYATQASALVDVGQKAMVQADDDWQSLGVFSMVVGDEEKSNDVFQLAINKSGIVRGTYVNLANNAVKPLVGSLDAKSQRIAWTVGNQKDIVYDTGLYNLTQAETSLLVHYGKDRTEQNRLFRLEQPPMDMNTP